MSWAIRDDHRTSRFARALALAHHLPWGRWWPGSPGYGIEIELSA
ncbi:hypothetical protein ACQEVC_36330 [Plantactinospora sp. CA-294935]